MILRQTVGNFGDIADPFAETVNAKLLVATDNDPAARLNAGQKLRKPRLIASAMFAEQEQPTGKTHVSVQPRHGMTAFPVQGQPVRPPRLQKSQCLFPLRLQLPVSRKTAGKKGLSIFGHIQNALIKRKKKRFLCGCYHCSILMGLIVKGSILPGCI